MRDNLIETLRDCANALGELLPRDHAYRKIVDQANRLLDRHDFARSYERFAEKHANVHDRVQARGRRPESRGG